KKQRRGWNFINILGITQAVGDHARRYDDGGIASKFIVGYVLERFVTLHRDMIFMPFESNGGLPPQARQEVEFDLLLQEAVLVVKYFIFVEIALEKDSDFFSL